MKIRIVDYLRCVSNWDMIHANDVRHHNLLRQIETLIENQWVFSNITGEQIFHAKEYLSVSSTVQQLHFTEYEKVSFDSCELKNKSNFLRTVHQRWILKWLVFCTVVNRKCDFWIWNPDCFWDGGTPTRRCRPDPSRKRPRNGQSPSLPSWHPNVSGSNYRFVYTQPSRYSIWVPTWRMALNILIRAPPSLKEKL